MGNSSSQHNSNDMLQCSPQVLPAGSMKAEVKTHAMDAWCEELQQAESLQVQIDELLAGRAELLDFPFAVSDPLSEGCPMLGRSPGFVKDSGQGLEHVIGCNCGFLVDPQPRELRAECNRQHARDFFAAVTQGQDYLIAEEEQEAWMAQDPPGNAILCFARCARKSGERDWSMFYMKVFWLGAEMDELQPYIIALQSELPAGGCTASELTKHVQLLDQRMIRMTVALSKLFFLEANMGRDMELEDDGFRR